MIKNELLKLAKHLGEKFAYVQGAGGNVSVKDDSGWMHIKASGSLLSRMNVEKDVCIVHYLKIRNAIKNKIIKNDLQSTEFGISVRHESMQNQRPSMEYGFHALLDKYVLHSHSVFVNTVLCSTESSEIITTLFPDDVELKYITPGINLTYEIQESKKMHNDYLIFFLRNHGLIVSGFKLQNVINAHEDINKKIIKKFQLDDFNDSYSPWNDFEYMKDHILFPDQAVFLTSEQTFNSNAGKQIRQVYQYIHNQMHKIGLKPNYLANVEAKMLLSLESEKYRKSKLEN